MMEREVLSSITSTWHLRLGEGRRTLASRRRLVGAGTESKMPIINLETKEVGCRKPGCHRRMEPTARHHRRCETMFVRAYAKHPDKVKTKRYKAFCKRYDLFDPRDIEVVCAHHHCEIHLIYDDIIHRDKRKRRKLSLIDYTWAQATALMKKLSKECYGWMERETPGRNPEDCTSAKRFPAVPKRHRRRDKHGRK